ncbi:hypothetical protein FSP39_024674 [Pinctada imbricata]|uniref:Mab-21-like HhH/H2TH-like domain-containing protein n=1 Tax=Pinctada imbricata TaxID=66713 RepID=A0AA88Y0M2_PINIB|nr:hypothetical protein FSP39_024674 [Pinctada imbricata]
MSGSRAEGFEFHLSDLDQVFVDRNAIVMNRSTLFKATYNNSQRLFLMETDNSPPGSAFVKCLAFGNHNTSLIDALVFRGCDMYFSSKVMREGFLYSRISSSHGPCQTVSALGIDIDNAYALRCPIWPRLALPFVERSHYRGWPSYHVLKDICDDGCLLVPINSKQQQHRDMFDLEWRISFSLAEKRLVHSMNHSQFLCYGLLKLFLDEVIKKNLCDTDLLCSYFIKTAVFWEISDNSIDWSPFNLLYKFWNTFRRLLRWVSIGYCPNFFIPENNMFYGKIFGDNQAAVLRTLRDLYSEGYLSLLRCSSLHSHLQLLNARPQVSNIFSNVEVEYVPWFVVENKRLWVTLMFDIRFDSSSTENIIKTLRNVLMLNTESAETSLAKRFALNNILQTHAENLCVSTNATNSTDQSNRKRYNDLRTAEKILLKTKTFFCSNYFFLMKQTYMTGNFHKTINIIYYIKHRIQCRPFMYKWILSSEIMTSFLPHGLPHDTLIKSFIVSLLQMNSRTSIEELKLECMATDMTSSTGVLLIPPLVFMDFLLILSFTHVGEKHRRHQVLEELKALLYQSVYSPHLFVVKGISWEILGICQHLCGDRQGALQSYTHAFNDIHNDFKPATIARISLLENN